MRKDTTAETQRHCGTKQRVSRGTEAETEAEAEAETETETEVQYRHRHRQRGFVWIVVFLVDSAGGVSPMGEWKEGREGRPGGGVEGGGGRGEGGRLVSEGGRLKERKDNHVHPRTNDAVLTNSA